MLSITHASIASAGTSLILGTADPLLLGLSIIGSQLPDLDTTTSTIGKIFFPISSWIEDRFPHRSITHSLLATAAIAAVSLSVNYFWLHGDIKTAITQCQASPDRPPSRSSPSLFLRYLHQARSTAILSRTCLGS